MKKKKPTLKETSYMHRVKQIGCLVCGAPAEIHHIREDQGLSQRASHYLTIPLCREHHLGNYSIHMSPDDFKKKEGSELELLAQVIRRLHLRLV